jgi:hypothetical protein
MRKYLSYVLLSSVLSSSFTVCTAGEDEDEDEKIFRQLSRSNLGSQTDGISCAQPLERSASIISADGRLVAGEVEGVAPLPLLPSGPLSRGATPVPESDEPGEISAAAAEADDAVSGAGDDAAAAPLAAQPSRVALPFPVGRKRSRTPDRPHAVCSAAGAEDEGGGGSRESSEPKTRRRRTEASTGQPTHSTWDILRKVTVDAVIAAASATVKTAFAVVEGLPACLTDEEHDRFLSELACSASNSAADDIHKSIYSSLVVPVKAEGCAVCDAAGVAEGAVASAAASAAPVPAPAPMSAAAGGGEEVEHAAHDAAEAVDTHAFSAASAAPAPAPAVMAAGGSEGIARAAHDDSKATDTGTSDSPSSSGTSSDTEEEEEEEET